MSITYIIPATIRPTILLL